MGLKTTELAAAQAATIRLRLLKVAALVRVTVRKVWISLPRSYPWPELFAQVHQALTG
ncbi:MAG: transposase [Bryobacterales bacterium]|nr:transposase [Bryobacterales bacterium]MBV9401088.1 transposase [Bryobacterales bacterium]